MCSIIEHENPGVHLDYGQVGSDLEKNFRGHLLGHVARKLDDLFVLYSNDDDLYLYRHLLRWAE